MKKLICLAMLIAAPLLAQTTVTNVVNITNIVNIVNVTNITTISNPPQTTLHMSRESIDWLSWNEALAARRRVMFQQQYWMSVGAVKY
jgi:hypothetical protein